MSNIKAKTGIASSSVTIASGANTSNVINLSQNILAGIITPANLRSITTLTIEHSLTETGTFTPYHAADGTAWTITLATSTTLSINPLNVFGLFPFIRFKGNANASGGDLVLTSLIAG